MCKVSVVLPVYNVAPFIQATLQSLLQQTFQDFEILILDDCSTDETVLRIQEVVDARIRLICNAHNLGRAGTDNAALAYVKGEYIAKMDGDDLCHPERLARQVAHLEANQDINVVGSWMQNFGASTYLNSYPTTPEEAQVLTLFTLPTGNPSVMLRKSLFSEVGMHYNASLRQTEDYDFFARYIKQLRIATLPEALIQYRVPPDSLKKVILTERATVADEVRENLLQSWGLACSDREVRIHNSIAALNVAAANITLAEAEAWLRRLLIHNKKNPIFDQEALQKGLGERWFEICNAYPQARLASVRQFGRSPLADYFQLSTPKRLRFWVKALRRF